LTIVPTVDIPSVLARIFRDYDKVQMTPACGRKLIEDAIAYARQFGLSPHADYKKAARALGGINSAECDTVFTFGKDGKPLYIQGPHDSGQFALRVVQALKSHCGEGNCHFILGGPMPDIDEEDQWVAEDDGKQN
jgi:hypothetical protein